MNTKHVKHLATPSFTIEATENENVDLSNKFSLNTISEVVFRLYSDPKCAFKTGIFSNSNWSCATIQAFYKHVRWSEKEHPRVKITLCESKERCAAVNPEDIDFPPELVTVLLWLLYRERTEKEPTEEEILIITTALEDKSDSTPP